eukprot:gnl/TRDRNA2_/TRDRNA2_164514_c0_seq2.p1 gnl/TRDRNA2_/TRDRNA2_164514_c0~~gnl/TRDRNA2_/TRDRNA2_164514_c0_seq2.p1  ORF type:complete len:401 (-),score=81.01 gnl/TRDRNA2_/TRDRNA2_164514_c0_seq2:29-1231(-)
MGSARGMVGAASTPLTKGSVGPMSPLEELADITKRLDELSAGRGVRLSRPLADIWASSLAAVRSATRFLTVVIEFDSDDAAAGGTLSRPASHFPSEATTAGAELRTATAQLEVARLRAHSSLAGVADEAQGETAAPAAPPRSGDETVATSRQALCPSCHSKSLAVQQADQLQASAATARAAVTACTAVLRQRCAAHQEELRKRSLDERRRLQDFVDAELDAVMSAKIPANMVKPDDQVKSPCAAEPDDQRPCGDSQHPRCVLDALRRRAGELRRQQSRRLDSEHLEELRHRRAAELMKLVDGHLEEAWERSMSAWLGDILSQPTTGMCSTSHVGTPIRSLHHPPHSVLPAVPLGALSSLPIAAPLPRRAPGAIQEFRLDLADTPRTLAVAGHETFSMYDT